MVQNNDMPLVFTMNLAADIEAMSRIAERAIEKRNLRTEDGMQPLVKIEEEDAFGIIDKKYAHKL